MSKPTEGNSFFPKVIGFLENLPQNQEDPPMFEVGLFFAHLLLTSFILYFSSFEYAYFFYISSAIVVVMMTNLITIPIFSVVSSLFLMLILMIGENTQTKLDFTRYIVSISLVFLTVFLINFVDSIKNKIISNIITGSLIFLMLFFFIYFKIENWLLVLFLLVVYFFKPFDIHTRVVAVFASISIVVVSLFSSYGGIHGLWLLLVSLVLTFLFFTNKEKITNKQTEKESFNILKLFMSVVYMVFGFFAVLVFLFVLFRIVFFNGFG